MRGKTTQGHADFIFYILYFVYFVNYSNGLNGQPLPLSFFLLPGTRFGQVSYRKWRVGRIERSRSGYDQNSLRLYLDKSWQAARWQMAPLI